MLANAFSLNMLPLGAAALVSIVEVSQTEVADLVRAGLPSCIGHQATADVLSTVLGVPVACRRDTVTIVEGSPLYVAQYVGDRLPEGATTLPNGARFVFLRVSIVTRAMEDAIDGADSVLRLDDPSYAARGATMDALKAATGIPERSIPDGLVDAAVTAIRGGATVWSVASGLIPQEGSAMAHRVSDAACRIVYR